MNTDDQITHRRIWAIAGPMMLSNVTTPIMGMVDTAVVGHLNSAIYIGAVGLGAIIFTFLYWGFGFLRMVTTGLTSQHAANASAQEDVFWHSALLALLIGSVILALQVPIGWFAFEIMHGSEAVTAEAERYFSVRIWSAPATLLNYAILGWLIGREKTQSALAIVVVINLTNIVLDIVFVTGLGMTASGVALASVIAEFTGLSLGLTILYRQSIRYSCQRFRTSLTSLFSQRQQLNLHMDFMIRTWCLLFCFAFFTNQSAKAGDVILAANMVLLNFYTLTAYVLDAFANATEVLSGKAVGSKNRQMLKQALFYSGLWALVGACLFSLSYWLFGSGLIALMTSLEDVQVTAETFLIWSIIGPVVGVSSYVFDGLFVGATLGKAIRNTMLFSALCCYLPAWYLLQAWGNDGLWAALLIFLAARALSQAIYLPSIFRKLD